MTGLLGDQIPLSVDGIGPNLPNIKAGRLHANRRHLMDELDVSEPGALLLIGPDAVLRTDLLPPYDPLLLSSKYMRTRARR